MSKLIPDNPPTSFKLNRPLDIHSEEKGAKVEIKKDNELKAVVQQVNQVLLNNALLLTKDELEQNEKEIQELTQKISELQASSEEIEDQMASEIQEATNKIKEDKLNFVYQMLRELRDYFSPKFLELSVEDKEHFAEGYKNICKAIFYIEAKTPLDEPHFGIAECMIGALEA